MAMDGRYARNAGAIFGAMAMDGFGAYSAGNFKSSGKISA